MSLMTFTHGGKESLFKKRRKKNEVGSKII